MKKLAFLLVAICLSATMQAAVSKTVPVATAGTLHTYFNAGELTTVTDLIVSGTIDARDFKFMKDTLTALSKLDISTVTIPEYYGAAGTASTSIRDYAANAIPGDAFSGKSSITSIKLPTSITEIMNGAFAVCLGLTSMVIPAGVTTLHDPLFYGSTNIKAIQFNNPTPTNLPLVTTADGDGLIGLTGIPCVIYVPVGSRGNYNAPVASGGWNLFSYSNYTVGEGQIPTAVKQTVATKFNINTQGNSAVLSGLTIGDSLDVYSMHGYSVYTSIVDNETMAVNLPVHGVYVVKVGMQVEKVII